MNPIEVICPIAKKYGAITIVDAVSSIGGIEVETDDDSIGGFIEVQGTGIFYAGQGSYTATFRGWLRGSEPDQGTDQGAG